MGENLNVEIRREKESRSEVRQKILLGAISCESRTEILIKEEVKSSVVFNILKRLPVISPGWIVGGLSESSFSWQD